MRITLMLLLGSLMLSSCSKTLYPDRSQFIKDGELAPTVDLSTYKSVQLRPGQNPDLAVAIAISGGGSRAANLGVGIMLGLEDFEGQGYQNLLKEVDYLSTVSGGGFAGGAYVTTLYDHNRFRPNEPFSFEDYVNERIQEALAYSYAGALLRANFNPRLWFTHVDDGDALERAIDDQVLGYKNRRKELGSETPSIQLGDMFIPQGSDLPVQLPMHITNSSTVNTMQILPFTPDVLETYGVVGYTHRMQKQVHEFLASYTVPLSVGIKSSGSFPVLISNTTLISNLSSERPFLHLFDGAMTDNTGYYTALQVLKQEAAPQKILIIIDADAVGNRYTFSEKEGALFSLGVAARLPSSGLDARRATLIRDILDVCMPARIEPVFLGFNVLLEDNDAEPPTVIKIKAEQTRLIQLLKSGAEISDQDKQTLYELLTYIGTKYTIEPAEQELLLLGGQLIVRLRQPQLESVLR
ncbi:MAG: patatin-like phospholipase family protein [Phaeodactylibacter sp.]|uniref:patatin-like phospholipase family protein n=1 Tax=Phaeodactylibacter sp. TaxID=1940289 RepID=UPI0032EFE08E